MSRNKNLNQFDDLIDELKQAEERPSIPPVFKTELRGQLLNQYEQSRFSWGNVRQWAGTAVALGVLALIVIYAWSVLSQPTTTGAPVSVTRPARPTEEAEPTQVEAAEEQSWGQAGIDVVSGGLDRLEIGLGSELTLTAFAIEEGNDDLHLTLDWLVQERPSADYQLFFHLRDGQGNVAAQTEQPLQNAARFATSWNAGERIRTSLTLNLPDELMADRYDLLIGLYDAANGTRLPVTVANPRQSVDEGTAVWLTDWFVEHKTPFVSENCPCVWLVSATQYARTSIDDPITLIIDVAYHLYSDEEVVLKPLYANPNWESVSSGTIPIDGLGDAITLTEQAGTQTIIFTERPNYMRQRTGTDQPVLVMQMGYIIEHEDGRRELKILAMPTITDFAIDLTSTEEITYQMDLSNFETFPAAVVSGTDGNGLTLRSAPGGQQIGVLEEGSIVLLLEESLQEIGGLDWQSVSTTIGKGWVVAEFLTYIDTEPINAADALTILDVSPPVGTELHGRTTFTVTVAYNLASLNTAQLNTMLRPFEEGPAILTNDVQIISMGERELTYSFEFEPFASDEPSDWLLIVQMADPNQNHLTQPALASASPHVNLPDDVYHYEP